MLAVLMRSWLYSCLTNAFIPNFEQECVIALDIILKCPQSVITDWRCVLSQHRQSLLPGRQLFKSSEPVADQ